MKKLDELKRGDSAVVMDTANRLVYTITYYEDGADPDFDTFDDGGAYSIVESAIVDNPDEYDDGVLYWDHGVLSGYETPMAVVDDFIELQHLRMLHDDAIDCYGIEEVREYLEYVGADTKLLDWENWLVDITYFNDECEVREWLHFENYAHGFGDREAANEYAIQVAEDAEAMAVYLMGVPNATGISVDVRRDPDELMGSPYTDSYEFVPGRRVTVWHDEECHE